MSSKQLLIIFSTAFIIVGLYHLFLVSRFEYPEFRLKEGQVAETEVIAPFDFPILKPSDQLSEEQDRLISEISKPYTIDDGALFDALSLIDKLWGLFYKYPGATDVALVNHLFKAGFKLSAEAINFAVYPLQRDKVYDELRFALTNLYSKGIYGELKSDTLSIWKDESEQRISKQEFYSTEEALSALTTAVPQASVLISEIKDQLIQANIVEDNELYDQLKKSALRQIPETEGVVLQNEIVIRKHSRVSSSDVAKLQSLLEAYRSRDVHKTPLQQLLLAIGMLIYIFVIIFMANQCIYLHKDTNQDCLKDFLPVNIGLILIALFGVIVNHLLSLNSLVIPLAAIALSAAILIGMSYGMLYTICSVLILSPFINWETFPPIVFLFSTIATIIMIERQKAHHEYLSIWFYLLGSSLLINIALSIYRSDPIGLFFKNLGFSVLSASLSIMGIILIVPFYEKKWNRATRQTLLELVAFDHPLFKSLSTNAYGTYQHSLNVGSMAELAAEAIGANPLLARAGSFYHDIGKIENSQFFTENNPKSSEEHEKLSPQESAALIRNHVAKGISLAKQYKLPQPVIDIIAQHHGDKTISYFLDEVRKSSEPYSLKDFQYPGPRPKSKEASLVMIADIVQSTAASKTELKEGDLEKIIDDSINRLIKEDQLSESPLSMKDLNTIKKILLPILISINHKRLDYPQYDEQD